MNVEALLARLQGVRKNGKGWQALCPAHADKNPSLSISLGGVGNILVHCHAGCSQESVFSAMKLEPRELSPQNGHGGSKKLKPKIVATYDYKDEKGTLLYQKVRYEPKAFRQRRPDGNGGWTWKLDGVRRVLYRLSEVLAEESIIVCEGEKDAETARSLGIWATTGGSAEDKWFEEYTVALAGKNVAIVADADAPGQKKGRIIAHALTGKATSVRLLEMPAAKDLSEWVEKGGTQKQLQALINGTREWTPERVDGSKLLDDISTYIRRFVSLSDTQARVAVAWIVHTHTFDAADSTPYLAVTSAEKQSGKTRLLEVLETLVANPWLTGRVTAAVLIRKTDAERPTLLLDESDAAFGGEEEYAEALRGVLNTGHRRGGKTSCCVGQGANINFKDFSTFSAKVIAGIGKLPDTVADRAIPIRLKRATQGERIERFRRRDVESEAARLKTQLETWAGGVIPTLRDARPKLPDELTDRQQDGAEPLLAISDAAGGDWPEKIRQSLVALCTEARADDGSIRVRMLNDIREIFLGRQVESIFSADLVAALCEIETSPWAEWSKGKPLSVGKLAWQLHPFEVAPHNVRIGETVKKGYDREDFANVWERYLPPISAQQATQNATAATSFVLSEINAKKNATENQPVEPPKVQKHASNGPCSGVAPSNPGLGEKRVIEVEV